MDGLLVRKVLMIAFHYPPMVGSSGMQRTLSFSNGLLQHGWHPTVLTVAPVAHLETRDDQVSDVSNGVKVVRSWALDAARHLSIGGKYLDVLARPDRWANWMLSAVPIGLSRLVRDRYEAIWSTYPISTAHCIAYALHRASGIPWVADFRDMMVDEYFPDGKRKRATFQRIEARTVEYSEKVVVTAPGTRDLYVDRYPGVKPQKFVCIRNGYNEDQFQRVERDLAYSKREKLELVHSGSLHPDERDPTKFFEALSILNSEGFFESRPVVVKLRATGFDGHYKRVLKELKLEDIVTIQPGIAYSEALSEMILADGLLLFQGSTCNRQIPAKLYEYMRAGRPILAITDPAGDTANTMRGAGIGKVARMASVGDIKSAFESFIRDIASGTSEAIDTPRLREFSRQAQAKEFAQVLDSVSANQRA